MEMKLSTALFINTATIVLTLFFYFTSYKYQTLFGLPFVALALFGYALEQAKKGN